VYRQQGRACARYIHCRNLKKLTLTLEWRTQCLSL
jgi:hypothetical protein